MSRGIPLPEGLTIFRHEILVDDQWHTIRTQGEPLHVASRRLDVVELWAWHDPKADIVERHFRVFRTGQPIDAPPGTVRHLGAAIVANGSLVWHLVEWSRY